MKFRAHETFFIRKGWLYKGLKNVQKDERVFVSKVNNPIDVLGLGSNMVKSLRYWMKATGLTKEPLLRGKQSHQELLKLAEIIYKHDRYFEELGTLYLIHYMLASNADLATSWYVFFNEFNQKEFDKNDFKNAIYTYVEKHIGEEAKNFVKPVESSVEDDFNCLTNSYVPRKKLNPTRVNPESNIECPLDELGLIDVVDKKNKIYKKTSPKQGILNPYILYAVIIDQLTHDSSISEDTASEETRSNIVIGGKEIKISSLLEDTNNVGKIFNLDINTLSKELDVMSKLDLIDVVRTAGLDVVKLKSEMSFYDCIEQYYSKLNG